MAILGFWAMATPGLAQTVKRNELFSPAGLALQSFLKLRTYISNYRTYM